jgi:sec1 family domain-containing protein 1
LKDFESELYENIYINFTSAIEENLLEKFAVGVGKSNGMYKVKRVLQHEVNFIALNRNLFSFNLNNIYSDFLKSDLN